MKFTFKLHFLYVNEMEQAIQYIETSEFLADRVKIIEKRYFKSPVGNDDSGALILEMADPTWMYNIGFAVALKQKAPF